MSDAVLIDCDVHIAYGALDDLVPYLDGPSAELVRQSGTYGLTLPTYPYQHPTGWVRGDTYERKRGGTTLSPSFTREQLSRDLLDPYSVAYAVAVPDEAACFAILPKRSPRCRSVQRVQRLALRPVAHRGGPSARYDRRARPAPGGRRRRDPPTRASR